MSSRLVFPIVTVGAFLIPGITHAQLKDAQLADYEQWRLAQKGSVADPKAITTLPGFQIELVHVARPDEGSWISMAFDPKGRPWSSAAKDKGLMRLTLAGDHKTAATVETIENTLLECRGLLFAPRQVCMSTPITRGDCIVFGIRMPTTSTTR